MIARACLLLAIAVALWGCSGSGAATPAPSAAASAGSAAAVGASRPATPTGVPATGAASSGAASNGYPTAAPASANPTGIRASGGLIRVGNFYRAAAGKQAAIDVYGNFPTVADAPLLVSVPYGTVTDWFDPGVIDDNGDAEISFFPAGTHAPNDAFGTQSETLLGGERFTIFLATSTSKTPAGVPHLAIDATFETGKLYPLPTAPTGQAVLTVDAIPLAALPGAADNLAYLAAGTDCLTTLDELGGGGPQPFGGGSSSRFAVPAGSQKLSFHADPSNCTGASLYPEVAINLAAGDRAYLVLYSVDDKAVRTLLLPIGQ